METIFDTLTGFIGEETFFNIVATVAATVWAWFLRKTRLDQVQDARFKKAINFVEAGVSTTYREFVKERKRSAADGKLTEEEKKQARRMAFDHAERYAYREGLDLVRELGGDLIPGLIEKSVGKLKKECGGPRPNAIEEKREVNKNATKEQ